jgi:hypothetical protein
MATPSPRPAVRARVGAARALARLLCGGALAGLPATLPACSAIFDGADHTGGAPLDLGVDLDPPDDGGEPDGSDADGGDPDAGDAATGDAGPPTRPDGVGVFLPATARVLLRRSPSAGAADVDFTYGAGPEARLPVFGDWNGDGLSEPGLLSPTDLEFSLRLTNTTGPAELRFRLMPSTPLAEPVPVAGDWDGDGTDTVGVYDRATGFFYLMNSLVDGPADLAFSFGAPSDRPLPIAGDWDGDGVDTVGVFLPEVAIFYVVDRPGVGGAATASALLGIPGTTDLPLAGDWDGDGRDGIGLYDPALGRFALKNVLSDGVADRLFDVHDAREGRPLAGRW